jgi:hypothetical protein
MKDNIFTKLWRGETAIKTAVNVNMEMDNETIVKLVVAIILILFINILLIKLMKA